MERLITIALLSVCLMALSSVASVSQDFKKGLKIHLEGKSTTYKTNSAEIQ